MRRMKTMGSQASGTTYIELDNVEVPVENLIGKVLVPQFFCSLPIPLTASLTMSINIWYDRKAKA